MKLTDLLPGTLKENQIPTQGAYMRVDMLDNAHVRLNLIYYRNDELYITRITKPMPDDLKREAQDENLF